MLCYLQSKTRDEAAREVGCSASTLKRRLERGKERMRERLAQAATIDTASYVKDRFALERVRRTVNDVFAKIDLLITPTTPVAPITIEAASNMPPAPAGEIWLRNTRPFNAYGLPTISIPTGFTSAGLPIGLQIAGPRFGEGRVLRFAHAFEHATDWHKRAPRLSGEPPA